MIDISEYKTIYKEKNPLINIWWISISFVIFVILVIFKSNYYEDYYVNDGILIEENSLKIYVLKDDLDKITTNSKLKIKNKKFAYKIKSISDILFNTNYYYEVIIESNLDNNINIKNNIIEFKILLDKKTILEYIIHKIGGLHEENS